MTERCARSLGEQWNDRTGAVRRIDHVEPARLDLLSDESLDAFRARFGSSALDAADERAEAMSARLAEAEEAARVALEHRVEARPIPSVIVCMRCGAFEVGRTMRLWEIDRAMRRTGMAEREVRAVVVLLIDAGCDGRLDGISAKRLRELGGLVGEDVDSVA